MAAEPVREDRDEVLYRDAAKGEMTVLLKWEPGASLPFHRHPEIEQSYVLEGSFYDHGRHLPRRPSSCGAAPARCTRPIPTKDACCSRSIASRTSSRIPKASGRADRRRRRAGRG